MIDNRLDHKPENTAPISNSLTTSLSWLHSTAGMRCEYFEKQWLECASRLGRDKGLIDCQFEMRDFNECKQMVVAYKRYQRMQEERIKKGRPYQDPPPYGTLQQDNFKVFF